MLNREDLHFVIRVRGKGGVPVYHLVLMDDKNNLFIRWSRDLPVFDRPKSAEANAGDFGSLILDMTKFSQVEIFQLLDNAPAIKEIGKSIRGTMFKTKLRVWDLSERSEKELDLSTQNEAHLLFDIDYHSDTVNFISLYNHAHRDEVVAMIIKKGTAAQILLFDLRLDATQLTRRSGQNNFIDFLKNFRLAFTHFAEVHYPDGRAVKIANRWRTYAEQVVFNIPNGSFGEQDQLRAGLKELYGLKLVLAASLLDRCPPQSAEHRAAKEHLESYLPKRTQPAKRLLEFRRPEASWSRVVFGLPQLNDMFDELPHEPARLQPRTNRRSRPDTLVINKDDLDIPAEFRDFWNVVKIDPE